MNGDDKSMMGWEVLCRPMMGMLCKKRKKIDSFMQLSDIKFLFCDRMIDLIRKTHSFL